MGKSCTYSNVKLQEGRPGKQGAFVLLYHLTLCLIICNVNYNEYFTQLEMQPGSFFGHPRSSESERSTCSRAPSSVSSIRSTSTDETPLRRRGNNNITISSSEIGKIFDALNMLSTQLKNQGEAILDLKNTIDELATETQGIKDERKALLERLDALQNSNVLGEEDLKIPPEISVSAFC